MKKIVLLSFFAVLTAIQLHAQDKLKTVQEGSVLAAPGVKVDGNISEWKDNFQAYNKAVKLYYTLANDDKYLYLIAKSSDITNIAKIQAGGINILINTADKKNDKNAYSLTYPVVNRAGGGGRGNRRGGFGGDRSNLTDSAKKAMLADAHKQFIDAAKEIKVLGFKDITDTLISIYNEYSIKSAVGYDSADAITIEIAIPLKALGLSADQSKEFAYHIVLNGLPLPNGGGFGGGGGGRGGRGGGGRGGQGGGTNIDYEDMLTPTDFWGKYTLAKP
ncbi:hypothetical protein [Mucilaginibacter sp. dw_454]|uniref:hypothetical protein n=1 Tax=Mucilaginibacter sp. dw_454 TaxID=2720079 RepID=UPI001BD64D74|nr:hypothetical protein [Mucilaginibacter sp. dw_454]